MRKNATRRDVCKKRRDIGPYENRRSVRLRPTHFPTQPRVVATYYESVRELERPCENVAVMACQHFASESHREATEGAERRRRKRRLISFGLTPDPRPSSYVTMGFPVEISS